MSLSVIVDSDVISYTFKKDSRHLRYRPHLEDRILVASFMTIAELDYWAESHGWGARKRADLSFFLQPYIVIESDRKLCRMWSTVREQVRRSGRSIQTSDAWIAATALLYSLPLVTHNAADYDGIAGLTVISEPDKN